MRSEREWRIDLMGKLRNSHDFLASLGILTAIRLNVARLASIPKSIIDVAAIKSAELEASISRRKVSNLYVYASSFYDVFHWILPLKN